MLMHDPDHFGHNSTSPPNPNITRKWASVRDLDDLYAKYGRQEEERRVVDLRAAGYQKLLGGGSVSAAYTVLVPDYTKSAAEKVGAAGGEVLSKDG